MITRLVYPIPPIDARFPEPLPAARSRLVVLPNRIVMGSMHTQLESRPDGPERLAAFYAERARGGAASS
jgi:2,4-dienoyl-CoA reductase (NADPH2)